MEIETRPSNIRFLALITTILITIALFVLGWTRIRIDRDIVKSLPKDDSVIMDAVQIFNHHPFQDLITIDIGVEKEDRNLLVAIGRQVEAKLKASGLFKKVGFTGMESQISGLVFHVVDNLPFLFSEEDLRTQVLPQLAPERIVATVEEMYAKLQSVESIGQAAFVARDPLGLRNLVLARLAQLAPTASGEIFKGSLLSSDGKHLLVSASAKGSSTDTGFAQKAAELIGTIAEDMTRVYSATGNPVTLTAVGAYRAALDNETIVRRDVRNAIVLATIGIALLLFLAFPRPFLGLLALLPAVAGMAAALFVYTWFYKTISIMVVGFGGAIISITVDHGIAYLLFLDRPYPTYGKDASNEVWTIGLLAAATSVGAFGLLGITNFPIFQQLGLFTALGIAFSFLFVHTVFPLIFPHMPAASPSRSLPLQTAVDRLASLGTKGVVLAAALFVVMLFFAKPHFNINLSEMNSVTEQTRAAEAHMMSVWGNIFDKVHLMIEGDSLVHLQERNDVLLAGLEREMAKGAVKSAFSPSQVFPGRQRQVANYAAWRTFWGKTRVGEVRRTIEQESLRLGFSEDAFVPFFNILTKTEAPPVPGPIPEALFPLLGISFDPTASKWYQVTSVTKGSAYEAEEFHALLGPLVRVFDPAFFSERLGHIIFTTFVKMLAFVGASVVVLLALFFMDWRLVLVSLLPLVFGFVCTLGTLGLMGRPLDIPALMLSIIVFGMGIDYSLFFVRSYQRYHRASHPFFGFIRMAVFMASVSTLIGFAFLCTAEHTLLKSVGVTSFLAIGYCLMGAFFILPPILSRKFENRVKEESHQGQPMSVDRCFQNMEVYPRFFARLKVRLDPMFSELEHFLSAPPNVKNIIDIGCGYGVPGCWLLARYPSARLFGIEPEADRVRVASLATGPRGSIVQGEAPQMPAIPVKADLAVVLDMSHYLDDEALTLTLRRLRASLAPEGRLIVRSVVPPDRPYPWLWWMDNLRFKLKGKRPHFRSAEAMEAIISATGFELEQTAPSGTKGDLCWFSAKSSSLENRQQRYTVRHGLS